MTVSPFDPFVAELVYREVFPDDQDQQLGVAVTEAAARADVDVAARADLAERLRADLSARDGLYRAAAHGQSAIPGSGAVA